MTVMAQASWGGAIPDASLKAGSTREKPEHRGLFLAAY